MEIMDFIMVLGPLSMEIMDFIMEGGSLSMGIMDSYRTDKLKLSDIKDAKE